MQYQSQHLGHPVTFEVIPYQINSYDSMTTKKNVFHYPVPIQTCEHIKFGISVERLKSAKIHYETLRGAGGGEEMSDETDSAQTDPVNTFKCL